MRKILIAFLLFTLTIPAFAADEKPLPIEEAFKFSATAKDAETLVARWKLPKGYFLYKEQIEFRLKDGKQGTLSPAIFPIAKQKDDGDEDTYMIYTDELTIGVPFKATPGQSHVDLLVDYQGCSSGGFCYPPTTKLVSLSLTGGFGRYTKGSTVITDIEPEVGPETTSTQGQISKLLASQKLLTIIVSFIGFGLLLSFTPCVLPMIPILSGIIVGHKQPLKTSKAFMLSLVYVLSMSFTYAIAGMFIGYLGSSVQALMQKPWIIVSGSIIFALMALSFFGFYELQLPERWQNKLTMMSNRQKGGTYLGVAIMGVVATLVISPCVTPALVGALAYIGNSGNASTGAIALFSLGIGMGLPLLAIGTAHGHILPKAGPWMNAVKAVFGVIMLAMAIWLLGRLIPGPFTMLLWAVLLIVSSIYLGTFTAVMENNWHKLRKGFGIVTLIYGAMMMVGAAQGNDDPFLPLTKHGYTAMTKDASELFTKVKSLHDVDRVLHSNVTRDFAMLDFYADWCVACKNMQNHVFQDPTVQKLLSELTLIKADVTRNDEIDKQLQQHFGVIAPPALLFFDKDGNELPEYRIVGEIGVTQLLTHLQKLITSS